MMSDHNDVLDGYRVDMVTRGEFAELAEQTLELTAIVATLTRMVVAQGTEIGRIREKLNDVQEHNNLGDGS